MTLRSAAVAAWEARKAEQETERQAKRQSLAQAATTALLAMLTPGSGPPPVTPADIEAVRVTLPDGPVLLRADDLHFLGTQTTKTPVRWTWRLTWQQDEVWREGDEVGSLAQVGRAVSGT